MSTKPDPKPAPHIPADALADVNLITGDGTSEALPEIDSVDEAPKPPRLAPDSALTL